jgi:hypothetical protein
VRGTANPLGAVPSLIENHWNTEGARVYLLTTDITVCYEEGSASTMPMKCATSIERWLLGQLLPYARNARTLSDEQVAQIAASIKEFGFVNPILVGPDRVIIAGHGRLLAARKLGMTEVPVIVIEGLTENQRRALVLAHNKL